MSYLSKIEQGKVDANEQLLLDLFDRLEVSWQESSEMTDLRDELYEGIFSTDHEYTAQKLESLEQNWDQLAIGPCYADFVVTRAFHHVQPELVPKELIPLLEPRQQALLALLHDQHEMAHRVYPCALTAHSIGEEALAKGNYTLAFEYFHMAARDGYAIGACKMLEIRK